MDTLDLDLSDPVETFPGAFNPFFGACQVGNIPIVKVSVLHMLWYMWFVTSGVLRYKCCVICVVL